MAAKKEGKRTPTVNVSFRLDPKTKYLVDLLARHQKRTITGVIEWALETAASHEYVSYEGSSSETFTNAIDDLWSTDEATRVIKLALYRQSLLDYDEMRLWETIRATEEFWKVRVHQTPVLLFNYLLIDLVQKYWDDLVEHVKEHRNSRSIVAFDLPKHDIRQNGIDANGDVDPFDDPDIPY